MATIDAAAAQNVRKSLTCAAIAATLALSVTACTTGGGGILDGLGQQQATTPDAGQPSTAIASTKGTVLVAPLIGPPDTVSKQLKSQVTAALGRNAVQVLPTPAAGAAAPKSDYTLRGYVVAAKEAAGTKVSYIWDVTNATGQRVHRITGEEVVQGASATNPWQSVSPQVMANIANRTASALSAWMPKKQLPANPQVPLASGAAQTGQAVNTAANSAVGTGQTTVAQLSRATKKTGSIPSQPASLAVVVPRVSGAPGDGSTALASALQSELRKNGIALASGAGTASAHRVEGKVALGAPKSGKQSINIDWVVKDPKGVKLGTVSQKNEIPAGSLNGKWGPTAGAAAAAAAQGIVRLLPRQTAQRS